MVWLCVVMHADSICALTVNVSTPFIGRDFFFCVSWSSFITSVPKTFLYFIGQFLILILPPTGPHFNEILTTEASVDKVIILAMATNCHHWNSMLTKDGICVKYHLRQQDCIAHIVVAVTSAV